MATISNFGICNGARWCAGSSLRSVCPRWPFLTRNRCTDILNAPQSFLDDVQTPKTSRSFLSKIKHDNNRRQKLDEADYRLAYYYIRAWAIERGLYRRKHVKGDSRSISPAQIVEYLTRDSPDTYLQVLLSIPIYKQEADSKHACSLSRILFQFFENFSSKFTSLDGPFLGCCPRIEDEAWKWENLLLRLRELSIQSKMECPFYIRTHVILSGSEISGGTWLRDVVEPGVTELGKGKRRSYLSRSTI